ncbi:hypothetical protein CONLIGDRAFT_373701 [Coniochaeta ligniaria NRRL 30616]|uniref:SH3 domain-containing protein n=1 Tax=Coniochaeta ligniaria NRRL 30616 TaxID=1408157 RepID=A0A1J7JKZ4_9PEZI|nr:hypothetical protein CONLIGDRAFT_373701 [Coniochaeta ligniaria NRRL 30616]
MSFKVKAIYEYNSGHDDDLKFGIGQIITVTEEEDADWYAGEYIDESGVKQEGIFPRNFVEKYEPTAPPRPTRTRTKNHPEQQPAASDSPAPAAAPLLSPKLPAREPEPKEEPVQATSQTRTPAAPAREPAAAPEPTARKSVEIKSPPPAPKSTPAPQPAVATQSKPAGPPPVSEKPSSFKDRIAAFNKSAAPPIAPFKPSGLGAGGSGFIKKPFVAPPPSRNAYVPPAQSAPVAKVYRREEDPEIKEREAETQESAEKAGLVPGSSATGGEAGAEDEPKPLSLKERLALLQKQQMEAAQRHTDAVAKKEKPKRPAKKRTESHEGHAEESEASIPPPLDRRDSEDVARKQSLDEPHPPRVPHPPRRKSSKGPEPHDGNEADMSGAGETTEGQDDDLTEREDSDHAPKHIATAAKQDDERLDEDEVVDEDDEDEAEEEEDDVDPEVRRKEELRARMARIAGGMGGMGGMGAIFGGGMPSGPAPAPPKKKKSAAPETTEETVSPSSRAPPVPTMMALPGMSRVKSAEETRPQGDDESDEEQDETELRTPHQESSPQFAPSRESAGPPPVPGGRPAPPPVPAESRPALPPPAAVQPPSRGSESDDELSERAPAESLPTPSQSSRAPPPLPPLAAPSPVLPTSPTSPNSKRRSYISEGALPTSPTTAAPPLPTDNRRNSRAPPPLPGAAPVLPPSQSRPPPPPPPGLLSRSSTADTRGPLSPTRHLPHAEQLDEDEEVTEYEGDYDTDIASSAPHKDALKSHQRESSFEETASVRSPETEAPPSLPPPVPSSSAPRGPPPIPSQPPPESRKSVDAPRAAPPPPPKEAPRYGDDDYDPFNYTSPPAIPSISHPPPPPPPRPAEEPYYAEATSAYQAPLPDRRGPPPAPPSAAPPPRSNTRQSLDVQRPAAGARRSVDVARPSMESGFVANELDLASQSGWWLKPNSLPPQLQGRKDIYFESEESTSANPRGKTIVTRDIYVLFQDYSQTVITVRFDPHDQSDVQLEQRHEAPPRTLRQDQLEQSYERFGRAIGEAVASKQNTVVGDGTPQALVLELLRPHREALLPVGTRAYGALVYSNLANASTTQNDEIRVGDVVSIRNAKFQGKHGPMHAKYSVEVGKPDHVGIVAEWDGTKKKVRVWEGRVRSVMDLRTMRR